ncbi:Hydrogenase 2 maturation protease [uncultured Desulfobacterium sp.]|uniref:Hydrogenase 2 maturation protease n=1 Tax=uncultured Desulfobacterium sp. TaxID=201089 RepID=A0A445N2V6_9BACT|nr:Hydrogenase 2 maturation protease [uncultured Desulfobacterium sp.]
MDHAFKTCGFRPCGPRGAIVLIGVGNEFAGDDGVGHYIARKLKAKDLPGTQVEFLNGDLSSLIEAWRGKDSAIIFDAAKSGAPPGKIYCFEASSQSVPGRLFTQSSHKLGLAEAVELSRQLSLLPSYTVIYGVEGKSFNYGVGLSPEVKNAALDVVEQVTRYVLGGEQ